VEELKRRLNLNFFSTKAIIFLQLLGFSILFLFQLFLRSSVSFPSSQSLIRDFFIKVMVSVMNRHRLESRHCDHQRLIFLLFIFLSDNHSRDFFFFCENRHQITRLLAIFEFLFKNINLILLSFVVLGFFLYQNWDAKRFLWDYCGGNGGFEVLEKKV